MKNIIIGILVLVVVLLGGYMIWNKASVPEADMNKAEDVESPIQDGQMGVNIKGDILDQKPADTFKSKEQEVIGKSVEGSDLLAYHYGTGSEEILFVGGIHGGYGWNTFWLASNIAGYLKSNPETIPSNLKVTVIADMNPDGVAKVIGRNRGETTPEDFTSNSASILASGRFNANGVDLNRNFDCNWSADAVWQSKKVSAGSAPFSEPESMAIKNYIQANKPKAVVVWYAAAGGVYSSACGGAILPETKGLNKDYAKASGYRSYDDFDAYPTSGDMVDWLAKLKIPAISVLLTNHTDVELDKNIAGVKAVLSRYAK